MISRRIGFDARFISDRYHGIGRYGFGLLDALSRLAPELTFVVFTGRDEQSRFDLESLKQRPNIEFQDGPWPMYWPREQIRWPALLAEQRIDLFHSPYFVAPLLASSAIVKIITVHDLIFDRYPEYMPWRWSRPYYRLLMRWGSRRAARILTVSRSTAMDLRKFYRVSNDKIRVVAEGVDPIFFPRSDNHYLQEIVDKYRLHHPFILSVGARRPHKNHVALVKSFAHLKNEICHDLVFVGPADRRFKDDTSLEVRRLNLMDRVHFLDWVNEKDLPGLYALADLVVLPSLVEGFGLPALEAMACGTPVIASNRSSYPEVIGDAGIMVDSTSVGHLADAIALGLKNLQLRQRMQVAGIAWARNYTWNGIARQVLKIYSEVLT